MNRVGQPSSGNVLRIPGFAQLLCGRLGATAATQIQSVVVGWQIYAITHSPLTLGYVGLAQFLPMAALTLPAGDLADRFDRRRILGLSWMLQGTASALFLWLSLQGSADVAPFYAVLVLFGFGRAFAGPAMQSFLPQLVPPHRLDRAIAWSSSTFQFAVIAGPALGGLVYVLGPAVAYGLCGTLLFAAAAAVLSIRVRVAPRQRSEVSTWARFTAGIAYVRSQPIVLGAISLDLFAVLFGGATALLPVYARSILEVGPLGLGALRSAIAVGALLMSLYLVHWPLGRHVGAKMFASVAVFGLATILFALSRSFVLSLLLLATLGAADMISVYVRASLIQLATPDAMRGRVSAVNMLFIGASNELGEFESGLTAGWFGTVPATILGGAATLAVVALWMRFFPALRKIDRLMDAARQENKTVT